MGKIKIQCEAITNLSKKLNKPRQCRAKGYFTPTSRRYLCRFHGCNKTINSKTRKYKGLYKNDNIDIDTKVKILKNLINFRDKTDEEIKSYINQEKERATQSKQYRTKYYTRHYNRWRSKYRRSKGFKDQLENFLRLLGAKSKLQK
jgi:hypothetical protein